MPRRAIAPAQPARELRPHYLDAILNAVEDSRGPATRRVYESAWKRFQSWAVAEGLQPLPADPMTVAAYLISRANQGLSQSTLSLDRKAISHFHRTANLPTPTIVRSKDVVGPCLDDVAAPTEQIASGVGGFHRVPNGVGEGGFGDLSRDSGVAAPTCGRSCGTRTARPRCAGHGAAWRA